MKRGKIQVVDGDYVRVVTEIDGEETVDRFTFEELLAFCQAKIDRPDIDEVQIKIGGKKKPPIKNVSYEIACVPMKRMAEDLIEEAALTGNRILRLTDGILWDANIMWDFQHPDVHYIVRILYARLATKSRWAVVDNKGIRFTDTLDDVNPEAQVTVRMSRDIDQDHPLTKAVMKSIRDREG